MLYYAFFSLELGFIFRVKALNLIPLNFRVQILIDVWPARAQLEAGILSYSFPVELYFHVRLVLIATCDSLE